MSPKLVHEIWVDGDGFEMCCIAGPDGDDARATLQPKSQLIHVFAAESHDAAMIAYNEYLGRESYSGDEYRESGVYSAEQIARQRSTANEWGRFHQEKLTHGIGNASPRPKVLIDWIPMQNGDHILEWNAVSATTRCDSVERQVVLIAVRRPDQKTGPAKLFPKDTQPTEALAREVAELFAELLKT